MTLPSRVWGARPDEVARRWACDDVHPDPTVRLLRAVDVAAPPALVYAWLGNLRAAPTATTCSTTGAAAARGTPVARLRGEALAWATW